MQSLLALSLAAGLGLWGAAAEAATVFDNFGPNQSFDTTASALIGPGPTGVIELGFAFTAGASGRIEAITAPFGSSAPPSDVSFNLYPWNGSVAGAQLDSAPARVIAGENAPALVVADQWQASLVAQGQYLMTASAATSAHWSIALNSSGGELVYFRDGVPGVLPGATVAAQVDLVDAPGPAPIPLPGGLPLVAGAFALLGLVARRRGGTG